MILCSGCQQLVDWCGALNAELDWDTGKASPPLHKRISAVNAIKGNQCIRCWIGTYQNIKTLSLQSACLLYWNVIECTVSNCNALQSISLHQSKMRCITVHWANCTVVSQCSVKVTFCTFSTFVQYSHSLEIFKSGIGMKCQDLIMAHWHSIWIFK